MDDLSTPLGKKKQKLTHEATSKYLAYAPFGALAAMVVAIAAWPIFVNNPNGGEPIARIIVEVPKYTQKPIGASTDEIKKPTQIMNGTALIRKIEQPQQSQNLSNEEQNTANQDIVVTDPSTGRVITGSEVSIDEVAELANDPIIDPNSVKLRPAPDPRLVEKTPNGLLPMVGNDGSKALKIYARPVAPTKLNGKTVRIAILVGGLGLSVSSTDYAIQNLMPDITLGFAPYGSNLQTQVNKARTDGHEILLQVPMEPFDYPSSDPGPHTLLTNLTSQQNADRLRWFLSRFSGYVGIINYMGGKFTAQDPLLSPIIQEVRDRGIIYSDDGSSSRSRAITLASNLKSPFIKADIVIDKQPSPEQIDARLNELEAIAFRQGFAYGTATALPISVDMINEWSKTLERRGISLVPVSAMISNATDEKKAE